MNKIISEVIDLVDANESLMLENKNLKDQLMSAVRSAAADATTKSNYTSAEKLLQEIGAKQVVRDLRYDLPSTLNQGKALSFEEWYKLIVLKAPDLVRYDDIETLIMNNEVTIQDVFDKIKDALRIKYAERLKEEQEALKAEGDNK